MGSRLPRTDRAKEITSVLETTESTTAPLKTTNVRPSEEQPIARMNNTKNFIGLQSGLHAIASPSALRKTTVYVGTWMVTMERSHAPTKMLRHQQNWKENQTQSHINIEGSGKN